MSKMQVFKTLFLAILLVSLISVVKATVSYVGFYNALKNLEFEASNIDLAINQESFNVIIDLEISNPTWYDGLHLGSIISTLYYEGENHTITISPGGPRAGTPYQEIVTRWWELPEYENTIDRPLIPYERMKIQINLTATGEYNMCFQEFYEKLGKYQEFILWTLESHVYLKVPTFVKSMGLEYSFDLKADTASIKSL